MSPAVCPDAPEPTIFSPIEIHAGTGDWFRHEHLDYEQLVGLADNALDATDREIIDIHLKVCAPCKEDVRSFLAFREQMEHQTGASIVRADQRQRSAFSHRVGGTL